MSGPWLREVSGGVYLNLKLQPRASQNAVQGLHGSALKIAVTAPPVDSAANLALIALLAGELNVSRSAIQIVRGVTSRRKTVYVSGVNASRAKTLLR